jgi:sulfur-oxidizing protein SoxY
MRRAYETLAVVAIGALALTAPALPASAGSAWDEIRPAVFGTRTLNPAGGIVELSAPARPEDQRAVPIAVEAAFKDGRTVRAVTLIVDENPTPVAAVFDIGGKRDHLKLATKLRLNAATDVRAIVEASDGQLYMADRFVKFAGGQASCSAPPQGDPQEIAANMGKMTLEALGKPAAATPIEPSARLSISHPNHTGMVLDQLTLLYIPLRIVTDLEVMQGEERVLAMKGSMTLSQNPVLDFDYRVNGAETMRVLARDSDGASWEKSFPIGQGS